MPCIIISADDINKTNEVLLIGNGFYPIEAVALVVANAAGTKDFFQRLTE